MREIKFRAWDEKDKKWLTLDNGHTFLIVKNGFIVWNDNGDEVLSNDSGILLQYTGLKDKNLYQGDIIEYPVKNHSGKIKSFRGVIEKDEYGFVVESLNSSSSFPLRELEEVIDEIKIIGNIYESTGLVQKFFKDKKSIISDSLNLN